MKSNLKILPLLLFTLLGLPNIAHAHIIGGNGLASGITHPILGLDHLLTMIAVGIISTQIGRDKTIWKVPATFISFMIAGGLIAIIGFTIPLTETGIALSVLIFGVVIALSKKIPIAWALTCVALSAIFHGHAHGEEMPLIANPVLYTIGFVGSTTLLHIMGVLIGHYAKKTKLTLKILQYAGTGMGITGFIFLLNF